MAYWSAFLEQSEKSSGTRIRLRAKIGSTAFSVFKPGISFSSGPSSTTTLPGAAPGLTFIQVLSKLVTRRSQPYLDPEIVEHRPVGRRAVVTLKLPAHERGDYTTLAI